MSNPIVDAAKRLLGMHRDLPDGVKWYILQDKELKPCKKCGAQIPYICAASPEGEHDSSYKHKLLLLAISGEELAEEKWSEYAPIEWAGRIPTHKRISQTDPIKSFGIWGPKHHVEQAAKEPDADGYSDINELMGAPLSVEETAKRMIEHSS